MPGNIYFSQFCPKFSSFLPFSDFKYRRRKNTNIWEKKSFYENPK